MKALNTIKKDHIIGKIFSDEDPCDPREWDNIGKMVCAHGRYKLGDTAKTVGWTFRADDFDGWDAVDKHIETEEQGWLILPLALYDHSGITMSVGRGGGWDSGQVGFIYCTKEDAQKGWPSITDEVELREKVEACLRGEVETYDRFLRGDVYGYVIEDDKGNHLDSCWGFFGVSAVEEEVKGLLDYHAPKVEAARSTHEACVREAREWVESEVEEGQTRATLLDALNVFAANPTKSD